MNNGYEFDAKKTTKELLVWLREWFEVNDVMQYLVYQAVKIQP